MKQGRGCCSAPGWHGWDRGLGTAGSRRCSLGGLVLGVMPLCAPQSTKESGGWGWRGQGRAATGWGNGW